MNSPPSFPLPFALPFALLLVFGCAGGGSSPDAGSDASAVDAGMADASVTDSAVDAAPPPYDGGFAPRLVGDVSHPLDDVLRLNQLQAEGTHNSYHIRPEVYGDDWDYTMSPLGVQLADEGVRQIELDLHWDRLGHRWHVFHIGVADPLSTCDLFLDCLAEVRRFSDSHPGHHPIFIQIEPKEPFRASEIQEEMDAMEAEIALVLPSARRPTSRMKRGGCRARPESVAQGGRCSARRPRPWGRPRRRRTRRPPCGSSRETGSGQQNRGHRDEAAHGRNDDEWARCSQRRCRSASCPDPSQLDESLRS